jgi:glycerol-3-phosphate dehydrogenase
MTDVQSSSREKPRVLVIGGGATGCGVARDLAMRGFNVTLVEHGDLGTGTSSRFHGMLQSGARYAVSDTTYAAECMRERRIIAAIAPSAVEVVGGLFVGLDDDSPDYAANFVRCCVKANIPVEELDPAMIMREEPALTRNVRRAFSVPDATINPWRLVNLLAADITHRGGKILIRHSVTGIRRMSDGSYAVDVEAAEQCRTLQADLVVNAAGPWSGRVASLLDLDVRLELGKGSILVLSQRIVGRIINRCRYPSSFDIIVPAGTVSLVGTTSEVVEDPGTTKVRSAEVQELLDGAEPLLPGIRAERALRAWAGVRPLVKEKDWPEGKPLPRRHRIIDHASDGCERFFTICGGSLTTHRSMAEDLGNRICASIGWSESSSTALVPLEQSAVHWRPGAKLERDEDAAPRPVNVCECELVARPDLESAIQGGMWRLHDIRRRLRLGFGPCQGTFCGPRAAEAIARAGHAASVELDDFYQERAKGMASVAWGAQARQILLAEYIYRRIAGLGAEPDIARNQ